MSSEKLDQLERAIVQIFLGDEAAGQFEQGNISNVILKNHVQSLIEISSAYNETENQRSRVFRDKKEAVAYALYFAPINFFKIYELLAKTQIDPFNNKPLEILDYGCGPGTASLAVKAYFENEVNITAVDSSQAVLDVAKNLWGIYESSKTKINITFSKANNSFKEQKYNIIIAANVLNELSPDTQRQLLADFVNQLEDGGTLLILEPALQKVTRQAMLQRNWLLAEFKELMPIFPCTRSDNCPMLESSERDWCHGELRWEKPRLVSQLDQLIGFNKHRIKYSAFIFKKNASLLDGYRVVSVPSKNKIGFAAQLCGKDTYRLITLTKKNRSDRNVGFQNIRLLDYVEIEDLKLESIIIKQNLVKIL